MTKDDMPKTEAEWQKVLTPDQYRVLRMKGTEAAFTGKYYNDHTKGMYVCAACGEPLFSSDTKFDSGTGWPSFDRPENLEHVVLQKDTTGGIERTEVVCKNCGSHLGHLFMDGPTETGARYCINSCALKLMPDEKK
ncbi:MAG: peptide-methionine (R)-S-oxide reductase MsrB [Patescibacteria group bacterium]